MAIETHVRNPRYQEVAVELKIRLHSGYDFNYHKNLLNQYLIQILSPWASDTSLVTDIEFGGRIYDSVVLNLIEELEYIDYVADFSLSSLDSIGENTSAHGMVSSDQPDVILVSAAIHQIEELPV